MENNSPSDLTSNFPERATLKRNLYNFQFLNFNLNTLDFNLDLKLKTPSNLSYQSHQGIETETETHGSTTEHQPGGTPTTRQNEKKTQNQTVKPNKLPFRIHILGLTPDRHEFRNTFTESQ